jgi:hypothetical protein
MSAYDGLNLPELLELMHELQMPKPISMVPETPGWWLLAGWLAAGVLVIAAQLATRRRRDRYRREAQSSLDGIAARAADDPSGSAQEIAALLKRTALAAYPRETVASLYGADWAAFLCTTAGNDPEIAAAAAGLAGGAYRADADGRALVNPARRWIRLHRA